MEKQSTARNVFGLIPAAGSAERLGRIAQSKEVLPVVFQADQSNTAASEKPACHHLLEGLRHAGVTRAFMVLRSGKWDIPARLAQNPVKGIDLSYVVIEQSAGVPWTLDQAYSFVRGSNVVMGFPDILIRPNTLFQQIVERLNAGSYDVVLGVVPARDPGKVDVVDFAADGTVHRIRPKPEGLSAGRAWIAAAWRPSFTDYMHEYLKDESQSLHPKRELYLGDIIAASLTSLDVNSVLCDEGEFIDIGTPGDLALVTSESMNMENSASDQE